MNVVRKWFLSFLFPSSSFNAIRTFSLINFFISFCPFLLILIEEKEFCSIKRSTRNAMQAIHTFFFLSCFSLCFPLSPVSIPFPVNFIAFSFSLVHHLWFNTIYFFLVMTPFCFSYKSCTFYVRICKIVLIFLPLIYLSD